MNAVDPLGLAEPGQAAWGPYPVLYPTEALDHLWVHFANIPAMAANTAEALALEPMRSVPAAVQQAEEVTSDCLVGLGVIDRPLAEGLDDLVAVGIANPFEAALLAKGLAQAASWAGTALRAGLPDARAEAAGAVGAEAFGVGAARAGEGFAPGSGVSGSWRDIVHGKAHGTTPGHKVRSYRVAIQQAKSGNYSEVHLNTGYRRVSGIDVTPSRRPDVISKRVMTGQIDATEVPQATDSVTDLLQRNYRAQQQLPPQMRGQVRIERIK